MNKKNKVEREIIKIIYVVRTQVKLEKSSPEEKAAIAGAKFLSNSLRRSS